jgi:hypothetical protein
MGYWSLLTLQAAAAAAPAEFSYVVVADRDPSAASVLAGSIGKAFPSASNESNGSFARLRFASCPEEAPSYHLNRCIRARLPAHGTPSVAFSIETESTSNVTGSVVHRRHTVWCIGSHGLGRIELPGLLPFGQAAKLEAELARCVDEALGAGDRWGQAEDRDGRRIWHVPLDPGRLAADAALARGWAPERAIVEVLEAVSTHRASGRCSFRGRIAYVESGKRLRAEDWVEFSGPCRWEGKDGISRMFSQGGLGAGETARIYLSYEDGALQYLEAL